MFGVTYMSWKSYSCEILEKQAIVIIDDQFQNKYPITSLPQILWIGVYCAIPTGGSFWHPSEKGKLDEIEDDLLRLGSVYGHGWMVYVMRINTPGILEYYLYFGETAEPNKMIEALRALHPGYRIESKTKTDREWIEYGKYVGFESGLTDTK